MLKQKLEHFLNKNFNFVLCNYYRNGDDYMGWHDDGEKEIAETIASISLGATRRFELKHKNKKLKESFLLTPGSLLVMDGDIQQYWLHRLPKDKNCQNRRINLTFRKITH